MTTPRDRVAFGTHAFPFSGLHAEDNSLPSLPMLPLRVRLPNGSWSPAFNAVLDTGSTQCLFSRRIAALLEIPIEGSTEPTGGAGGVFQTVGTSRDIAIVDAQFPEVTCWEVAGVELRVPAEEGVLDFSVLGWNLLRLLELSVSHRKGRIELRLVHEL